MLRGGALPQEAELFASVETSLAPLRRVGGWRLHHAMLMANSWTTKLRKPVNSVPSGQWAAIRLGGIIIKIDANGSSKVP